MQLLSSNKSSIETHCKRGGQKHNVQTSWPRSNRDCVHMKGQWQVLTCANCIPSNPHPNIRLVKPRYISQQINKRILWVTAGNWLCENDCRRSREPKKFLVQNKWQNRVQINSDGQDLASALWSPSARRQTLQKMFHWGGDAVFWKDILLSACIEPENPSYCLSLYLG